MSWPQPLTDQCHPKRAFWLCVGVIIFRSPLGMLRKVKLIPTLSYSGQLCWVVLKFSLPCLVLLDPRIDACSPALVSLPNGFCPSLPHLKCANLFRRVRDHSLHIIYCSSASAPYFVSQVNSVLLRRAKPFDIGEAADLFRVTVGWHERGVLPPT